MHEGCWKGVVVMGTDDSLVEDVIVQSGVKLSPEYDVNLPVALLWSEHHQRLDGSRIEAMKSHK